MKRNLEPLSEYPDKKGIDTPVKVFAILWHFLHLQENITTRKENYTAKNSSGYKLKRRKEKKRETMPE